MGRAIRNSHPATRNRLSVKVLVTGATGFIGRYVIADLLQRPGIEVVASGTSVAKAALQPWYPQVQFVPFDLGTAPETALMAHFGHPDKLIHLAWGGLPNYKKLFHFEEELPRQYAFLKRFIREGLQDLTISGTCFEYGMQEGLLREDMPANPANPYALAKDCLRRFLTELQREEDFSLKWVRLFYMWGDGQSETAILPQLKKALQAGDAVFNMSGGEQIRDYLPVETVAENIASIALQNAVTGIINCSSNAPVTINQLVTGFLEREGGSIELNRGFYPYPDYEPFAFYGDNHKLNSIKHQTP